MAGSNLLPLNSSDLNKNNSPTASSPQSSYQTASSTINKPPPTFQFVIRFANGSPDIVMPIDSVEDLKDVSTKFIRQQIRQQDKKVTRHRLKLIRNGKVLLNHTDFQKELKFLIDRAYDDDGDEEDDEQDEGAQEGSKLLKKQEPIKIYIHCIVGDILSSSELAKEEELEHQPEKSTSEAPKGFDRLLSQGFSQQDIFELRQQFQQIHGSALREQEGDALRELEDRWIDSTVNHEIDEFPTNVGVGSQGAPSTAGTVGTAAAAGGAAAREVDFHRELLFAIALGFFLGIFSLFLIKLEVGGFFNKRTRMAVIAGVFINLTFGFIRIWS